MVKSLSIVTIPPQQRSSLTLCLDHEILAEGKRSQTIPMSGCGFMNKGGNPEQPQQQEYDSIANGVGENPLNGKGMAAVHYERG